MQNADAIFAMHCKKANNDTSPAITDNATEFSAAKYIIVFIFWLYCIVICVDVYYGMGSHFYSSSKDSQHQVFKGIC